MPQGGRSGVVIIAWQDLCLRSSVAEVLIERGHKVMVLASMSDAIAEVRFEMGKHVGSPVCFILDYQFAKATNVIAGEFPDVPRIVILSPNQQDYIQRSMDNGAVATFTPEKFDVAGLLSAVDRALAKCRVAKVADADKIIGKSPTLLDSLNILKKLARSECTIFLVGETGTGKELAARYIHANSPRKTGPLVAVNAAALPAALIESELFGHVKGAFTGAFTEKKGLLTEANGGTLFLDEIAALPHHVQASLLRALQFKIIKRVGGNTFDRVDARIIAATNQDINDTKTFRPDLRYRLGEPVVIPPLRHRKEDIPALAAHFLAVAAALQGSPPDTIAYDALQSLLAYSWPGNIRELETVLQFCSAVCENGEIKLADLPTRFRASEVSGKKSEISDIPSDPSDLRPLTSDLSLLLTPLPLSDWTANQERAYIESVRDRCGGDAKAASAVLQISPATFYRKLGRVPS